MHIAPYDNHNQPIVDIGNDFTRTPFTPVHSGAKPPSSGGKTRGRKSLTLELNIRFGSEMASMTYGIKTQVREGALDEISDWLVNDFEHDFHLEYTPEEPNFGFPVATVLFDGDVEREAFLSYVFLKHDNEPDFPIVTYKRFEWDGLERRNEARREFGERRAGGNPDEWSDRRSLANRRQTVDRRNNLTCL